jgi:hypothetical protein
MRGLELMIAEPLPSDRPTIRGADTNTLFRLYDRAKVAARGAETQMDRDRAARSVRMITRELRARDLRV